MVARLLGECGAEWIGDRTAYRPLMIDVQVAPTVSPNTHSMCSVEAFGKVDLPRCDDQEDEHPRRSASYSQSANVSDNPISHAMPRPESDPRLVAHARSECECERSINLVSRSDSADRSDREVDRFVELITSIGCRYTGHRPQDIQDIQISTSPYPIHTVRVTCQNSRASSGRPRRVNHARPFGHHRPRSQGVSRLYICRRQQITESIRGYSRDRDITLLLNHILSYHQKCF
jgi:hypothetical protein